MVALSPPAPAGATADVRRPLFAVQIRVFVLCALVVLLDGYDLQAMGSGVAGVIMSLIALGAIFYPPQIRVTGFGRAGAVSRVGAVLGPLAGGWIIAAGVSPRVTLGLVAVPSMLCILGTLAMRRSVAEATHFTTRETP